MRERVARSCVCYIFRTKTKRIYGSRRKFCFIIFFLDIFFSSCAKLLFFAQFIAEIFLLLILQPAKQLRLQIFPQSRHSKEGKKERGKKSPGGVFRQLRRETSYRSVRVRRVVAQLKEMGLPVLPLHSYFPQNSSLSVARMSSTFLN